jgi:hypothetical protein
METARCFTGSGGATKPPELVKIRGVTADKSVFTQRHVLLPMRQRILVQIKRLKGGVIEAVCRRRSQLTFVLVLTAT